MKKMTKLDALLIGAINYDVYALHKDNSIETSVLSDGLRLEIGGGASITAIALARLGLSCAVAGSVGNDAATFIEKLDEKKVKHFLKQHHEVGTALTLAIHYQDGNKRHLANTTSNKFFTHQDLRELFPQIKNSKLVMRTGYPWMPQIAGRPTAELFNYARENNVITALDMSNPETWEKKLLEELVSDVVPNIDLLCANEKELYRLAKKEDELEIINSGIEEYMAPKRALEYAHRLLLRGVKIVNLHYGKRGTMLLTKDEYIHIEPLKVERYVNPTGCGNLQNVGIIYCMLNDKDLRYAAKFANTIAVLRLEGNDFPKLNDIEARKYMAY